MRRYQLIMRDGESLAEKHLLSFSYARLISIGTALLGVLLMCSLVLATSILAKWFNPAYVEQENKQKLIQLATAVDALEEQTAQQKKFIALLQHIIAGKEPPADELPVASQKQPKTLFPHNTPAQQANANTLLHSALNNTESSLAAPRKKTMGGFQQLFFFPPISDTVTTPFKQNRKSHGIEGTTNEHEPIQCVADGVVVFAAWTVETGWGIVIQHGEDLLSTYKHNTTLFKNVGSFVKKGEIIATRGNPGELATGPHAHFELWCRGKAVSPEYLANF